MYQGIQTSKRKLEERIRFLEARLYDYESETGMWGGYIRDELAWCHERRARLRTL